MNKIVIGENLKDKVKMFRETCFGLVIQDNKFLCVKDCNGIALIGGGLEKGETYEECLKREFLEEAGRKVKEIKEFCTIDCYWKTRDGIYMNSLSNIFIVQIADEILIPTENKDLVLIEFADIIDLLPLPYQKEAIKQYFIKEGFNIKKIIINEKINITEVTSLKNKDKVVIYCHGLGNNKEQYKRFYKKLYRNNISMISFDLPAHGEDKTEFENFTLKESVSYLINVIKYAKVKYKEVYLFGSSYGGFVILNYLIEKKDNIKAILMCPAFNFAQIINEKTKINKNYFKTNKYLHLYGNVNIYKKAYDEFIKANENVKNFNYSNIIIIQGKLDETVSYKKVKSFADKNKLKFITIEDGTHELYRYDKEIINIILSEIQ